ncbi:MAG: methylmalonyl-CoA mutase family protein [Myxococcota bacterium]
MDANEWQYRPEPDIAIPGGVGSVPSSRGAPRRGWEIVQTYVGSPESAGRELHEDLQGGTAGVRLSLDTPDRASFAVALDGVDLATLPVELAHGTLASARALVEMATERGTPPGPLRLDLGIDPYGTLATTGAFVDGPADVASFAARECGRGCRTYTLDDAVWHDAGADEAWCLALQLASGVQLLRDLDALGLHSEAAFAQVAFRCAMPGRFLLGIAKLRAQRRLWARIGEACSVDATASQTAAPAWREATVRDPWVNILRTTTAAFAGIVGGAERVDTAPFAAGDEARRLARNTQLVLRDEAHLGRVADPAGGSLALEALTEALAHAAWSRFQDLEREGGIEAALRNGRVQREIAASRDRLVARVRTRKAPILGVSRYPSLTEDRLAPAAHPVRPVAAGPEIDPVRPVRLAEPYEALREREPAPVYFATLGPLAEHTARTGFGRELVEAGGLQCVVPDGVETAAQNEAAYAASGARVAVISAHDRRFAGEAVELANRLAGAGAAVWMLGKPGEHEATLRAAGVRDFLFLGGDALATLDALWTEVQA